MDFNSTIDLIIKELNEASDIIDDLKRYPDVPVLQVELAKLKCKNAGDVIALLKTMKNIPPVQASAPARPEPVIKSEVVHPEKPVIQEEISLQVSKPKKETPPRENTVQLPVTSPSEKRKEKEKEKEIIKEQEAQIIADKFAGSQPSFYDKLGSAGIEEELADKLQSVPIQSLSDAIGLNDKFLFIREIFSGNSSEYLKAIDRLEKVSTLADARAVIMSYTGENSENEAVGQLLELVKRKLHTNE